MPGVCGMSSLQSVHGGFGRCCETHQSVLPFSLSWRSLQIGTAMSNTLDSSSQGWQHASLPLVKSATSAE